MAELILWIAIFLVVYTYFGYPALILFEAKRAVHRERQASSCASDAAAPALPAVTVVIPVFNEFTRLPAKLNSVLASDYPGALNIIVVADGSTDHPGSLSSDYPDVQFVGYTGRRGKPSALNFAVQFVKTPVVVFSDARQTVHATAIRRIVTQLLQPAVGAVSGELVHIDPSTEEGTQHGLYWRYEKFIRRAESRVHSVPGVSGALYAIRREDYIALPEDTLLDDFQVPAQILRTGQRVLFAEGAYMYDAVAEDGQRERNRKIRTLAGNYQAFRRNPWLFNPFENPIFFQFVSHKVMRLLVPYLLALIFVLTLYVEGPIYQVLLIAQVVFYLLIAVAALFPASRKLRLLSFVYVFWELNIAAVVGLKRYLLGQVSVQW